MWFTIFIFSAFDAHVVSMDKRLLGLRMVLHAESWPSMGIPTDAHNPGFLLYQQESPQHCFSPRSHPHTLMTDTWTHATVAYLKHSIGDILASMCLLCFLHWWYLCKQDSEFLGIRTIGYAVALCDSGHHHGLQGTVVPSDDYLGSDDIHREGESC